MAGFSCHIWAESDWTYRLEGVSGPRVVGFIGAESDRIYNLEVISGPKVTGITV